MTVTQLAKRLNISADTVRHYVRCGLLSPTRNPDNGYKQFKAQDEKRLWFILQCKALGFSLQDIQTIMNQSQSGQSPCPQVREIMSKRLEETQAKIKAMQQTYEHMKHAMDVWLHQGDCLEVMPLLDDVDMVCTSPPYDDLREYGEGLEGVDCLSAGLLTLDERAFNANKLDLAPDFDMVITRSIADIRNPEQRSSDYTKTLTIPATKNNNKIFGHIFEVGNEMTGSGQYTPDFDPNKKADCFVTADGIEQIRGFIRLTEIIVENNNLIGYNCTIHGETANLFTSIEDAKLADLDFSEYNHTVNLTNIENSWDTEIIVDSTPTAFEYGLGYVWSQIRPKRAIEADCTKENIDEVPTFIHMKSHVQNIPDTRISEVWTETLPTYYNTYKDFKVGNFQQLYPFHYVEKDWMSISMIKQMEKEYGIA